jgi:signal transduction histidine kinase
LSPDELNIFADENMLKAILRNLISNAIKFTHNGGRIDILAKQTEMHTIVTVTDNGIGMDAERINNLFDFTKPNSTPGTEKETGTGLGLLLCKDLIKKHKGEIWVESEKGKGTSFIFSVPFAN